MKFSYIIVSYNTKEILLRCLNSIPKNSEIIVVDNASADGSREMLETQPVKVIVNDKNLGFATACNQGAKQASGEILFFLNSDAEMNQAVATGIEEAFITFPKTTVLSPQIVDNDGVRELSACGYFPTLGRLISRRIACTIKETTQSVAVDWVSGAALAIRREIFTTLGGFDENFFMYFEDVDLCYRAKNLVYEVRVLPYLHLVHQRGKSLHEDSLRKKYYYQSQLYYFRKHFGKFQAFILMILRLPYVKIL